MQLPKPHANLPPEVSRYLTELIREVETELAARPRNASNGVLYLGSDRPVSLISPSGNIYRLTVDDVGNLVTTQETL